MNLLLTAQTAQSGSPVLVILYFVFFFIIIYMFIIKPQQKEKKKQEELMQSLAVGDNVLTTAGFYGTIIDMTQDEVIVEFGNNKNCRIPMQKQAIVKHEKPKYSVETKND